MRSKGKESFAHSIKNLHTKHWWKFRKELDFEDGKWKREPNAGRQYLCCNSYTPEKVAKTKKEVTCKNCLAILRGERKRPEW